MAEKPTYEELENRVNELMVELSRFAKVEAELKRSLRFTESLLSAIPTPIFFKDAQGRYQGCNPSFTEIMGVAAQNLRGKTVQELWPSEYAEVYHQKDLELMQHPQRQIYEFEVKDKDGTLRPVIFYKNVFHDEHGNVAGLVGGFVDITDLKRAEKERKMLQVQLIQAQKMEAIGTLAGGIAHNFNNILMGVQGRTSLMMMDMDPSDPDYEHLRGIEDYVKNAVEMNRDLLGFARGGKYEVKPTHLNALIRHENEMFGRTKKEIRIHGKYEKDLWTVEVDQIQLRQALLNLYVNAWQAMPGGGDLYIQTENVSLNEEYTKPFEIDPGRYVKVSVTDTGVGMDAATCKKAFDPFFSTKKPGEGSGLGLASLYGIIKNHGGFINVYSEKGEGATFNIYLPASKQEIMKEAPQSDIHEIQYGEETVLLVDDEKMVLEVGRAMLEKLGYRTFTAGSGKEALDLYGQQKDEINLVILDMIMPGMGGGETYDRLKAIGGDARVLLSSGYSINGQAQEILDRGCSGFIQKPFAMEELSRKVREVLDRDN